MNDFWKELGENLHRINRLSVMSVGVLLCIGALAVMGYKYEPEIGISEKVFVLLFAGLFGAVGLTLVLLGVRRNPDKGAGLRRLEDDTWKAFFDSAFANQTHNGEALYVDMVAHSLWSHFKPKGWTNEKPLDDFLKTIDKHEFTAHLWSGLGTHLSKGDVHMRVMIIKPGGHLADLVEKQQHETNEPAPDQGRQATEDGIKTLFVLRALQNHPRLDVDVRILKEDDLTMTYSLCRVDNAVLVGHYPFNLLSRAAPCSEFDLATDPNGRRFWEPIDDIFTRDKQKEHSIGLKLEEGPRTFEEFRQWVLSRIA